MTTRTFRQLGIGFGEQPANITAKINNVVVYQGPVTTLNEEFPVLPNFAFKITNVLFSWTEDITYAGPAVVEIQVDENSDLIVAEIDANYNPIPNPAFVNETETPGVANIISSGVDGFLDLQTSQIGDIYVDGTLHTVDYTPPQSGQHWWELTVADTIELNTTITPGLA
jgi:hypothetical protein